MPQHKHAMLIGSSQFPKSGHSLPPLPCAASDVREMESVLSDKHLSTVDDVEVLLDLPSWEVMRRISTVMHKASREDQILLYYSGHGLLNYEARLHLATVDTEPEHLLSTAVPADNLRSLIRGTQCRRIIILLDCCFAGTVGTAFRPERFMKDSAEQTSDAISKGYAVAVIAASAAGRAAFAPEDGATSYMTATMIESIRSREADFNRDGIITVKEVYDYTRQEMAGQGLVEPLFFGHGLVSCLTIANYPLSDRYEEIKRDILDQIEEVRAATRPGDASPATQEVLERAEKLLAQPKEQVLGSNEALFKLLKDWSQDDLDFEDLLDQWYQFGKTDIAATEVKADISGLGEHWEVVREARAAILDAIGPAYILDRNYHFIEWNSAFDELVARQIGLIRHRHVEDFILRLENDRDVVEHSNRMFPGDGGDDLAQGMDGSGNLAGDAAQNNGLPLVDMENLEYRSPKYGLIRFKKIASQIPDDDGEILAWSVHLNILFAEREQQMWQDLQRRLSEEVNWSIYAKLYDRMLNQFDGYRRLIGQVVDLIGSAEKVADLGAGTGNVVMELLRRKPERQISVVEGNEGMLEQLRSKFTNGLAGKARQVQILKGDILESLREIEENTFDGVIMLNVLYALHNPARCLREVYRVLKPGGVVVYSTSTKQTDIDALFDVIRDNMAEKGLLEEMSPVIDVAYDRNRDMIGNILRDSESDVVDYARRVGFSVDDSGVLHGQYAGAVTIVKAVKPVYLQPEESPRALPLRPREPRRPKLFISYAHQNRRWCDHIRTYLKPAERAGELEIWEDAHIQPGQTWEPQIQGNLESSTLALLLITPEFLASDYVTTKELPWLLSRRAHGEVDLIPVMVELAIVDAYAYPFVGPDGRKQELRLSDIQMLRPGGGSMSALKDEPGKLNLFVDQLAKHIRERAAALDRDSSDGIPTPVPAGVPVGRGVDIASE